MACKEKIRNIESLSCYTEINQHLIVFLVFISVLNKIDWRITLLGRLTWTSLTKKGASSEGMSEGRELLNPHLGHHTTHGPERLTRSWFRQHRVQWKEKSGQEKIL